MWVEVSVHDVVVNEFIIYFHGQFLSTQRGYSVVCADPPGVAGGRQSRGSAASNHGFGLVYSEC